MYGGLQSRGGDGGERGGKEEGARKDKGGAVASAAVVATAAGAGAFVAIGSAIGSASGTASATASATTTTSGFTGATASGTTAATASGTAAATSSAAAATASSATSSATAAATAAGMLEGRVGIEGWVRALRRRGSGEGGEGGKHERSEVYGLHVNICLRYVDGARLHQWTSARHFLSTPALGPRTLPKVARMPSRMLPAESPRTRGSKNSEPLVEKRQPEEALPLKVSRM